MPELPEVETVVRELRPHLEGRVIVGAHVDWARTIAQPVEDIPRFCAGVRGRRIVALGRRGKYVVLYLQDVPGGSPHHPPGSDPLSLLVHLRMSGRLLLAPLGLSKHLRMTLDLSDGGRMYFYDQRKFGRVWLIDDPGAVLDDLGPEPLSEAFTLGRFTTLVQRRRGMLKPLLLNQQFIAGLGNIYVDESLFRAGLHPQRTADTLAQDDIARLYGAIRSILQQALDHHGTTFDGIFIRPQGEEGRQQEGLNVYQQTGLPCVRCGTPIERTVVGGRGTHFCPRCQPLDRD